MYDVIQAEPGISVSQLARRAGVYWTAATFHVGQLERGGLVRSVLGGRRRALFATKIPQNIPPDAPALLAEPSCRQVAEAIIDRPGMRVCELCERLGMSERAVYHHVKRLTGAGLIVSSKPRGYFQLSPTEALLALLAKENAHD